MSLYEWAYASVLAVVLVLWLCDSINSLTAAVRELAAERKARK